MIVMVSEQEKVKSYRLKISKWQSQVSERLQALNRDFGYVQNAIVNRLLFRSPTSRLSSIDKQSNPLLAIVTFMPTIATWTGSYISMRVYVPKHHSMLLKSSTQMNSTDCKIRGWWDSLKLEEKSVVIFN
ncbi:hypothetical protein Dsin_013066 [Dipteronia sinensis]|uniref:Uncharacterized protein n=1 Tax=Dipteronia sinensis TaxID=43782 RepID=A0AAE0E8M4_9ROSI|nr:hypothetical protein Dsin_013066 [Dipteronia sinensis]